MRSARWFSIMSDDMGVSITPRAYGVNADAQRRVVHRGAFDQARSQVCARSKPTTPLELLVDLVVLGMT